MLCTNSYLEYVIACLLTHASVLEQVIQHPTCIKKYFYLSLAEENYLYRFLSSNPRHFLSAAVLAEEKRYRELRLILKYVSHCFTAEQFKTYWKMYLLSLSLHKLPQTPLEESLYFLNYLLCICKDQTGLYNIIQYEFLLNTLLKQNEQPTLVIKNAFVFDETIFGAWSFMISRIMLNPAMLKHQFSIAIAEVISHLKNTLTFDEKQIKDFYKNESCLFVFNHQTFTARTIVIQPTLDTILHFLSQPVYLIDLVDFMKRDLHFNSSLCLAYLNNLLSNYIIIFVNQLKE